MGSCDPSPVTRREKPACGTGNPLLPKTVKMRALCRGEAMSRGMKRVCRVGVVASLLIVAVPWSGRDGAWAQSDLDARAGKQLDSLVAIYKQLHANPELSTQEEQTSALIAKELRAAGFEVTDHWAIRFTRDES